jgi:hypothetical protein
MKAKLKPLLDHHDAEKIFEELNHRRPAYVPEWVPENRSPGNALQRIFSRYVRAIIERLNLAPEKNFMAFLDMMGIDLIPAQAARAPVVFQLADGAVDSRIPEGTQIAARPPPDKTDQIVFETENTAGIAAANLVEVVSLWPGRDQYADHSVEYAEGKSFDLFNSLKNTPHHIYLAHDTLLAFAGKARIDVEFELTQPGSEHLDILWEYPDGKVWRGFKDMNPACGEELRKLDATAGLTKSGKYHLEADCAETKEKNVNGIEAFWIRGRLTEPMPPDPGKILPEIDEIRLSSVVERALYVEKDGKDIISIEGGILPDAAFLDTAELDLTQSFYPFGLNPQPGIAFYFASQEIFSKPGAKVQIGLKKAESPQDSIDVTAKKLGASNSLKPDVVWEYWNGQKWQKLNNGNEQIKNDLTSESDEIKFVIPPDMALLTLNNQEKFWIRVRLKSGSFGNKHEVTWDNNTFTYIIIQPPAISEFRLGYTWEYGPFHAEHVLTYNDFQYEDQTYNAQWPGRTFQPFSPPADVTPTAYLGFDKKLPNDFINLFFNIEEQPDQTEGPQMVWEYYDGSAWRPLMVQDDTRNLALPGMLSFIAQSDAGQKARFGTDRYWIRGRLNEDGPPAVSRILEVYPNAVWIRQVQTITDELLGLSNGQSSQVFVARNKPVLSDECIEVRELNGARANVEWRILASELFRGSSHSVEELEKLLNKPDFPFMFEYEGLRLQRDANRKVTEVWVKWDPKPHLHFSTPDDRHYMIDRARGRIIFGDGEHGRIPPLGAELNARRYLTGGGAVGNVKAGDINQLLSGAAAVQSVFNPISAQGGSDVENIDILRTRGPRTLRYRNRAITASDFETIAFEANPAVAVARALPTKNPEGSYVPGWVSLVIIPKSDDPRPWPSAGLREDVREYIKERASADLALGGHIHVTGPNYEPVGVSLTVAPINPSEAGVVEGRVRQRIQDFLHPLKGGLEGLGWDPGRDVYLSDLASVVERVDGVDYVEDLALLQDGLAQGERVKIAPDRITVAGTIFLKIKIAE